MRKFRFKTQEELGDSYYSFFPRSIYDKNGDIVRHENLTLAIEGEYIVLQETIGEDKIKFPVFIPYPWVNSVDGWYFHKSVIIYEWTDEELLQEAKKSSSKFKSFIKELTHEEI